VQVASGIAHRYATSGPGGLRPGALPVQALDHTAGYLLAAAVMGGLAERPERGGRGIRVSLARVSHELQALPVPEQAGAVRQGGPGHEALPGREPAGGELAVRTSTMESTYGPLVHVPPPLSVDGRRLQYSGPPRPYGGDHLTWA
jgi:crotonobetainyl-CoA:carnitine CoA-transferase CaiB-like acyl-CoA transferase